MDHVQPCDCWQKIFHHLIAYPERTILPDHDLCQDAAYVAFVLDQRMVRLSEATDELYQLRERLRKQTAELTQLRQLNELIAAKGEAE